MPDKLNKNLGDMLRELGNIGCNRALTALSQLTATEFIIRVPYIELVEYRMMPQRLGDVEEEMVSVMLDVSGEITGVFLLLLRPEIALHLLSALGVGLPSNILSLSPKQSSALLELGNIMGSSYMTAVSEMTGLDINLSVPLYAVDMLGAILNMPIIKFAEADSQLLFIQNVFTIEGKEWIGSTLLLPELDSTVRLKEGLGRLL